MKSRFAIAIVATLGLLAGSADAEHRAGKGPELVQLSYDESNDGSSKRYNLSAYARRADAVTFSARLHHERLTAKAKFNESVTDTDLGNGPSSHPWEIVRKGNGKRVLRRIRRSLNREGMATVRVRIKGGGAGGTAKDRITIDAMDCSMDPPLYPLSCEIRP
jgi:hypothetical protein